MAEGPDRAVIIAGGGGTRLWPWTGPSLPKPLLPLGGAGRSLFAAALDRIEGLVRASRIAVQAPEPLAARLVASDRRLTPDQAWVEPSPRDTGPAIALAMLRVRAADPTAVVAVLPADQRVDDEQAFRASLAAAARAAREGPLVTLGVRPDHPSTRFGYIEAGEPSGAGPALTVRRFVEKPSEEQARRCLEAGSFLWNAGIFIWRADAFWHELERAAPELARAVASVAAGDLAAWREAPRLSIDYALMERAKDVAVVPLDAGWDDVGGWDAVVRLAARGEAGPARLVPLSGDPPQDSVVLAIGEAPPPRAILLGGQPQLVVSGPQGILVSPRTAADRVRQFVAAEG